MTGSKSARSGIVPGLPAHHGTQRVGSCCWLGGPSLGCAHPACSGLCSTEGGGGQAGCTGSSFGAFLWLSSEFRV